MPAKMIKKQKKHNRILPIILVLLVLAGGGLGYYYWNQSQQAIPTTAGASTLKTAQVRRGSISLSASGTGTLVAGNTQQLSFGASGTVKTVNVQVGDQVKQGQVLAQLGNLNDLQTAVNAAQQDLNSAQAALATLKAGAAANVANAELKVVADQKAVSDAQSGLKSANVAPCDQTTTDAYYNTYLVQLNTLNKLQSDNSNNYQTVVAPQKDVVAKALAAYQSCTSYTAYDINSSHAQLDLANAQLKLDQDNLTQLQQNGGILPSDLSNAQNKVENAQQALDQAQQNLDGATLKAPFDGIITAVAGQPGDPSGNSAFITIADLAHPQVQFIIDETDLDKVAISETAQVSFDAIPNRTFNGKVVRVNPALVTVNGYQTVQGTIQLDLSQEKDVPAMLAGMSTSVDLVKAQANNVLVIPVQALRDLGNGQYGVFVVDSTGQAKLVMVQVGLMDETNAEIKQGLKQGDIVSTGASEVKQ